MQKYCLINELPIIIFYPAILPVDGFVHPALTGCPFCNRIAQPADKCIFNGRRHRKSVANDHFCTIPPPALEEFPRLPLVFSPVLIEQRGEAQLGGGTRFDNFFLSCQI